MACFFLINGFLQDILVNIHHIIFIRWFLQTLVLGSFWTSQGTDARLLLLHQREENFSEVFTE
jgi:hypothetical protein